MESEIEVKIKPREIIAAIKKMKNEGRENFVEDLLASGSPDYLDSIKQAREDYITGRVKKHDEVFDI